MKFKLSKLEQFKLLQSPLNYESTLPKLKLAKQPQLTKISIIKLKYFESKYSMSSKQLPTDMLECFKYVELIVQLELIILQLRFRLPKNEPKHQLKREHVLKHLLMLEQMLRFKHLFVKPDFNIAKLVKFQDLQVILMKC